MVTKQNVFPADEGQEQALDQQLSDEAHAPGTERGADRTRLRDVALFDIYRGKGVDEIVCLSVPRPFVSVGAHYADFGQTTDPSNGVTYGYNMVGADPNNCSGSACSVTVEADITPIIVNASLTNNKASSTIDLLAQGQLSVDPEQHIAAFAGMWSEGFDRLWTPHRMAYIKGENKPTHTDAGDECAFCRAPGLEGEDSLVVARGEHVYAVLNLYPYNAGHLMICPYRHVADYTDLTVSDVAELGAFTQKAMRVVRGRAMDAAEDRVRLIRLLERGHLVADRRWRHANAELAIEEVVGMTFPWCSTFGQ